MIDLNQISTNKLVGNMLRIFERTKLERSLSIHQKADLFAVLMSGDTNFQLIPLKRYITFNTGDRNGLNERKTSEITDINGNAMSNFDG